MRSFLRHTVARTGVCLLLSLETPLLGDAGSGLLLGQQGGAADTSICLRIYNVAGISDDEMTRALTRLDHLMNRAGIPVTWEVCGEHAHCPIDADPLAFIVRLQSDTADSQGVCAIALTARAVEEARFMTVFTDCVARAADRFVVPPDTVLAYCLAHELGHLLMPPHAHRSDGIMAKTLGRIEWQRAAADKLPFSEHEAALLRAGVAARASAAANARKNR